jgi:Flp pilus assembly protein TadD
MRTTSSFEIFPDEPSERELSRARWLRGEGRLLEAETAYRSVMDRTPMLRTGWTECFELLRSSGKMDDALILATRAAEIFPAEAFPMALRGAAFIEQRKYRDAMMALEVAVGRDPDLALTWHEMGYAAYRLGDGARALAALDRAFALEPHTETLILRGRILRDSGELYAAEVSFEAALHSAEHEAQEAGIRREVMITRRQGAFPPSWVRDLTPAEQWFVEHGVIVLASADEGTRPTEAGIIASLVELIHDRGWEFGQLVIADEPDGRWRPIVDVTGLTPETVERVDPERIPLLVSLRPRHDDPGWIDASRRIADSFRGATFVLWHPAEAAPAAELVGGLEQSGHPVPLETDPSTAIVMAQHPASRLVGRLMRPYGVPSEAE